jgi:YD repeat-containing protein
MNSLGARLNPIAVAISLASMAACSSTESQPSQGIGGQSNMGGSTNTLSNAGSTSTGGHTSSAGSTSTGGNASASSSDVGYDPNATAGCPPWPSSQLFPFVGAFFYGTNPKPCSFSKHADSALTFQYDSAGRVVGASSADNTQTLVYTFTDGQLSKEVDTTGSTVTTYQFQYGTGMVTYTVSGGAQTYTGSYVLDARGYPQVATMVVTAPHANTTRYTYVYDNCRMVTRNETDDSGSAQHAPVQYDYDGQGRMVRMYATDASFEWKWDYSCR